jgi:Na+/H+ antiporter NhaD/arsenite permease-like protein
MPKNVEVEDVTFSGKVEFKGFRNVMYLGVIILSVFIDPNVFKWVPSFKPFPLGIREIIMFAVMYLSYKHSRKDILKANEFDFEPIKEVAYLFIGIFMTMVPALQLIEHEAHVLAKELDAGIFFWSSGMLSSVLDNTPTFLNFLSGALGRFGLSIDIPAQVHILEMQHALYLRAISTGAVFFGAMTYIGNGPNFMVKSITERAGIKMPSFFTYWIKYAVPVLIPTFFLVWIIFFFGRG